MTLTDIIALIVLAVITVIMIAVLIISIVNGDLRKYVEDTMKEAETMDLSGEEKAKYVIEAVKKKYKIAAIIVNVKKIIERVIDLSKHINYKG